MVLRKKIAYPLIEIPHFKRKALEWAQQYYEVVWLDSNDQRDAYSTFDALLAVDALTSLVTDTQNAFEDLKTYQANTGDWIFGYLSYDLKNDIELLSSANFDGLGFSDLYFFQPKKLIYIQGDTLYFEYLNLVADEIEDDFNTLKNWIPKKLPSNDTVPHIPIKMRIFKDEYFRQVEKVLAHVQRGDIYEANFCQEFYATDQEIDPLTTYQKLNAISKAPFSCFFKMDERYLLCASPERYLKKKETKLISQPIKGTAKRLTNVAADNRIKEHLRHDEKERAENIMIVDLVRNDLSKSAVKGSVRVEELCEVYSFEQVHQMISTVTAQVAKTVNPVDVLRETFPMGSMTGAPKIAAMKIIENLEATKRGLYSGAVGYFSPKNDFDFNVVIRSILYNAKAQYISFSVGGAITAKAAPEKEYEECLLKAKAMRQVLGNG